MLLEIPWDWSKRPIYWQNFVEDIQRRHDLRAGTIKSVLMNEYDATYETNLRISFNIRFKSDADMLCFIMKWS